ncbi:MAG: hypothetical protein HFF38_12690 [Lawsonibacter sp.]|nr:hypothetical protein [Lawsonibacter sp.]
MAKYTIYSKGIWERILDKHPDLRELALKCGVENNPQKALEIRQECKYNFGFGKLTDIERDLGIKLQIVEFIESGFLNQVVITGKFHEENGAFDYSAAAFQLVLSDFENSFKDWYREVRKRNMIETSSFAEFYDVFLEVITLKMEYKIPYTKLFIRKLLENSSNAKADSLEIKQYFLSKSPEILPELIEELIE